MSESETRATPMAETSHTTASARQDTINPAPTSTAHTTAQTTMHGTAPTANASTMLSGTHAAAPLTFNDKLNAGDRYWKFKGAFYAILIITGLIGIGCIGWLLTTSPVWNMVFGYGYDYSIYLWPALVTFTVSVIWSLVCILVLVLRKKPVHPGVRVAMDLLLWLGIIVTVMFTTLAVVHALTWGQNGIEVYNFASGTGDYELAANGTWVWHPDTRYQDTTEDDTAYINTARLCNQTSSYYEFSTPAFKDCDEQDAYVNRIWQARPHRARTELAAVVCQYIGLVLHFALFVWACVDTHVYNRRKVSKDAEKLAAGIVQTMINNGAVVPPPGQYARPGMYYQLPPQQAYPMVNMHPQQAYPPQPHMPEPSATSGVGSSNEKSNGPRFA